MTIYFLDHEPIALQTADDHFFHADLVVHVSDLPEIRDWLKNNTIGAYLERDYRLSNGCMDLIEIREWLKLNVRDVARKYNHYGHNGSIILRYFFTEERDIVLFKLFFS